MGTDVSKDFLSRISYPDGVKNNIHSGRPQKPTKRVNFTADELSDYLSDKSDKSKCSESAMSEETSASSDDMDEQIAASLKAVAMHTGMDMNKVANYAHKKFGKQPHKKRH